MTHGNVGLEFEYFSPSLLPKVLVANRGEIACRIFQTCRLMGIRTVAVYSDDDAEQWHVSQADENYRIGSGPALESYLNVENIIAAARATGARGVHPGYGFLSERAHFARAVEEAGLIWIGPSPEVIDLMGNKVAAKKVAEAAGVPTLPWALLSSKEFSEEALVKAGEKVGYPLLLKAAAGGGGRGMRLVCKKEEIWALAQSAAREAESSFGSAEIFLESYRDLSRHVEVQILGDKQGQIFCFGERDCSAQRRHQKVIEEAPAPCLTESQRKSLWDAARRLGERVSYRNAGTCEFLLDKDGNVYFLEMNTRLQVEHPVTEMVWGVDLVELQLRVAAGQTLPTSLHGLKSCGHSMEARVYAEDPSKGFLPSPGRIQKLVWPKGPRLRVDAGYGAGSKVPLHYDAMLGKIISWGMTRESALEALRGALLETELKGVAWNGPFLAELVGHRDFREFSIDTKWIERTLLPWKPPCENPTEAVSAEDATGSVAPSPWFYFAREYSGVKLGTTAVEGAGLGGGKERERDAKGPLLAENPGKVLSVKVKVGDQVQKGQVLVVCESMKMEFSYSAAADMKVKAVFVEVQQVVSSSTKMMEFE